jgi:hypothetical protein
MEANCCCPPHSRAEKVVVMIEMERTFVLFERPLLALFPGHMVIVWPGCLHPPHLLTLSAPPARSAIVRSLAVDEAGLLTMDEARL